MSKSPFKRKIPLKTAINQGLIGNTVHTGVRLKPKTNKKGTSVIVKFLQWLTNLF